MRLKKYLIIAGLLFSTLVRADLLINHREGTAEIGTFHLKIFSMDGSLCFERKVVDQYTQMVVVKDSELESCGAQKQYVVYGILHGWFFDSTHYGNSYPKNGGECTVSHDKYAYLWSKLKIECGA